MITNRAKLEEHYIGGETCIFCEFIGVSTDEKPTTFDGKKIFNGSTFLEIDTAKVYMFNQSTELWVEL